MILTKPELIQSINGLLPDNATQQISPLDLRTSLINIADSVPELMRGTEIHGSNFNTASARTTIAGEEALGKMTLPGRSSTDNSAFGYYSLHNNYNGFSNTAVGAYSLSCNLYGNSNTSIGSSALAGNTNGSGNVGIGSFALHNNKKGNFNIAIGHGAGWYVGPETDHVFVVASHAITVENTCDEDQNLIYETTESPLLFGDLKSGQHKLGIGTSELHEYGMLQVSGDISPTSDEEFSLGREEKRWLSINEDIYFSGGLVGIGGVPSGVIHGVVDAALTVYGHLLPSRSGAYTLGHPSLPWDGNFNDITVNGTAIINDAYYTSIEQCLYECKTIHLATSGYCDPENTGFDESAVCGILDDASLDGAGFQIHSSGAQSEYRRDYKFLFRPADPLLNDCFSHQLADEVYSKSRFESNISLEVLGGRALITDRVLARDTASIVSLSGCMGIFIQPITSNWQKTTIAHEDHANQRYATLQDVNFIARSGIAAVGVTPVGHNYAVMYGTIDSGVKVMQKFASRIKNTATIRGFSIVYHDELDQE